MQDYTALIRVCAEHIHTAVPRGFWAGKHLSGLGAEIQQSGNKNGAVSRPAEATLP